MSLTYAEEKARLCNGYCRKVNDKASADSIRQSPLVSLAVKHAVDPSNNNTQAKSPTEEPGSNLLFAFANMSVSSPASMSAEQGQQETPPRPASDTPKVANTHWFRVQQPFKFERAPNGTFLKPSDTSFDRGNSWSKVRFFLNTAYWDLTSTTATARESRSPSS